MFSYLALFTDIFSEHNFNLVIYLKNNLNARPRVEDRSMQIDHWKRTVVRETLKEYTMFAWYNVY